MRINGEPHLSTGCPARHYEDFDLASAHLLFGTGIYTGADGRPGTEVITALLKEGDEEVTAEDEPFCIVNEDEPDLVHKAITLEKLCDTDGGVTTEELRDIFCERIATCPGKSSKGECWALGAAGIRTVIEEYSLPD
ncbi:MAG TPA: hypothetical protein VLE73_00645 [Candidatus Saccharimonadales bacterium]|nr:hypothetical protein [Candidatus Saccharimonadales bacterium]